MSPGWTTRPQRTIPTITEVHKGLGSIRYRSHLQDHSSLVRLASSLLGSRLHLRRSHCCIELRDSIPGLISTVQSKWAHSASRNSMMSPDLESYARIIDVSAFFCLCGVRGHQYRPRTHYSGTLSCLCSHFPASCGESLCSTQPASFPMLEQFHHARGRQRPVKDNCINRCWKLGSRGCSMPLFIPETSITGRSCGPDQRIRKERF